MGRREEPKETKSEKIIRIAGLLERGLSYEKIRRQLKVGKDLVREVRRVMNLNQLTAGRMAEMDQEILVSMFAGKPKPKQERESIYEEPDYEYCARELMKPGVTKALLWEEYREDCIRRNVIPYQLTQFKLYLNKFISKKSYGSLITHKPGCMMEVDWTGDQANWFDPDTGEAVYGWLFVGVLSFSGLTYAEVFPNMKEANWIKAHTNMFRYFHGVTPTIRCDNLKTGVTSHPKNGMYVIQKDYKGLSSYYSIAVVPGEPLQPKSKPLVENTVKYCEQQLLAPLRNTCCYSLKEYNQRLAERLEIFNNKKFQQKSGSRRSIYEEYEKDKMCPLPEKEYEYCEQACSKVRPDQFICFDKNFYSVPKKKPGEKVTVYAYEDRIEIYDGITKLTSHKRHEKGLWKKEYDPAHFKNTNNGEWNKDRFLRWAQNIGPNTYNVVSLMFDSGPEQIYYSKAHSLLKLTDKYTAERVENACIVALRKVQRPSYKTIRAILENNQDLKEKLTEIKQQPRRKEYSYLGEEYAENGNCKN